MNKPLKPPNETTLASTVSLQNSVLPEASASGEPSISVPARYLNYAQIKAMTGLSKTTLWRLERKGCFPTRIRLGPRTLVWEENSVLGWIASRPRGMNDRHESR